RRAIRRRRGGGRHHAAARGERGPESRRLRPHGYLRRAPSLLARGALQGPERERPLRRQRPDRPQRTPRAARRLSDADRQRPPAKGGLRPPDGRWDGIYLDGGSGFNRIPTEVLDPIWARTIVVGNGLRTISVTVLDQEGVFKEIWDLVRQKVHADGVVLDEMFMSSTHNESAPDTIGIGGPSHNLSGGAPLYIAVL